MRLGIRDRLLLRWGKLHIGEVIRRHHLQRAIAPLLRDGMRVLDAGCGRGDNALRVARRYLNVRVDAVDIDPNLVELVQRRITASGLRNVRVLVGDVAQAEMEQISYGTIYAVDVFEHLRDPRRALVNLARALAPGGSFLLHVPRARQRRWLRRFDHYEQHDHERDGFEPDALTALVRDAGLAPVEVRHTFGPPGALAWELFHLTQGVGKWFALLTYPLPRILAWIDGWFRWSRGNGLLVVTRK